MAEPTTLDELSSDHIWNLYDYHPFRLPDGDKNPDCNAISKKIMDLKPQKGDAAPWKLRKTQQAIKLFSKELQSGISDTFAILPEIHIAIVPSSQKGITSKSLIKIVESFNCANIKIMYSTKFLVRTITVASAHEGGSRSIQKHLESISVELPPDPNIPILLLDDVTTTGSSLKACKQLLLDAGANHIIMIAIGKTVI